MGGKTWEDGRFLPKKFGVLGEKFVYIAPNFGT